MATHHHICQRHSGCSLKDTPLDSLPKPVQICSLFFTNNPYVGRIQLKVLLDALSAKLHAMLAWLGLANNRTPTPLQTERTELGALFQSINSCLEI